MSLKQNLQIVWQDWLHMWHGSLYREGQDIVTADVTATHTWQNVYKDTDLSCACNFFFPLQTYLTIRLNRKPTGVDQYNLQGTECHTTCYRQTNKQMKWRDIRSRTRDDLVAMVWREQHDMCERTNMHNPPATEGNFVTNMGTFWTINCAEL
jgi:hypothetical protein